MFPDLLRQKLTGIVDLTTEQIQALEAHYQLLLRWNRVLNLTSVDSLEEAVERHYAESLFLTAHLPTDGLRIVDIGSGAGFPGIPVAILRPDCSITLIESHQRKAVFLREATRGMPGVTVLALRAQDVKTPFDCVISRAVSYEDLTPVLSQLAGSVALLTGSETPPSGLGFVWNEPIPLPWGKARFLRTGVSRETRVAFRFT